MILTCPECATRFFVRDQDLPPQGRKVRCSSCQAVWTARPEMEVGEVGEAPLRPSDSAAREFALEPPSEAEPPLPSQIRARVQERRETRQAMAAGVVWALLCAGFAAVLVGAVLFKVQIVRVFPAAAGAYAAVKLPVNPTGLSLENVQGGPGLVNGRAALVITGVERNIEIDARPPAPVLITLYDKAGKTLVEAARAVEGAPLAPGETRPFTVDLANPPLNAAEFQVSIQYAPGAARTEGPAHGGRAEKHAVSATVKPGVGHGPELRGEAAPPAGEVAAAPVTAQPLPAGSPYALPNSEATVGRAAPAHPAK
jgi:predicted Zn finger-like uncharacterized protein